MARKGSEGQAGAKRTRPILAAIRQRPIELGADERVPEDDATGYAIVFRACLATVY